MPQAASKIELDSLQRSVLQDLSVLTYDEVEAKYGWSRGRIYNLAKRTHARKTAARIAERRSEREQRQREALEALIEKTTTMDVLAYLDYQIGRSSSRDRVCQYAQILVVAVSLKKKTLV